MRRAAIVMVALAAFALPTGSNAIGNGTGFRTGSCRLPAGEAMPGGGAVLQTGPGKAFTTITSAVAAASPGDTILIYPGVYAEGQINVNKPGLRIRGTDRNAVVLDGQNTAQFGLYVRADRVVIENMTGHNFLHTAFYWLSVTGYWGRYLTAYNNEGYGVYAYDSRCGQIDHSYGSGNADSAFYIGECYPCDAVIEDVEAAENALGFSGTNAGGSLTLRDSWWHDNGLAIVPNSLDSEAAPPQRGLVIENNLIESNNGREVPGAGIAGAYWGIGIAIAGGSGNQVIGNTIRDHALTGIVLAPLPGTVVVYVPGGNIMWGNAVSGSGLADLAQGATSGANNCWDHNTYERTAPPLILETVWGCTNTDTDTPKLPWYPGITPAGGDPRVEEGLIEGQIGLNGRAPSDWRTWPAPGPQLNQPDDDNDSSYVNDGGVDTWLPALL